MMKSKLKYCVGWGGITKIELHYRNGQMAKVPWYRIWTDNALDSDVNGAMVIEVQYK